MSYVQIISSSQEYKHLCFSITDKTVMITINMLIKIILLNISHGTSYVQVICTSYQNKVQTPPSLPLSTGMINNNSRNQNNLTNNFELKIILKHKACHHAKCCVLANTSTLMLSAEKFTKMIIIPKNK